MYQVYILYSLAADKYYIGVSKDVQKRIEMHNDALIEGAYTQIAKDWSLFFQIDCNNKSQALKIEKHIKKMKSRVYIENLKKYPNISKKLLLRYS